MIYILCSSQSGLSSKIIKIIRGTLISLHNINSNCLTAPYKVIHMIANHFLSNVFLESVFWAEHLTIKYIPVKRKFSARAQTLLLLVAGQGSLFCSFAPACHYVSVEQTLTVFSFNIQPFTHLHNSFTIYNSAHIYTTHLQVSIFILKSYIYCSVCFKLC